MRRPIKVGVFGTHSTGKSSFLDQLQTALADNNFSSSRVPSLAVAAKELGFPILKDHTFNSTLWLMTKCITLELESSNHSVILTDRAPIDALGYFLAACEWRNEKPCASEMDYLSTLVRHHSQTYDFLLYSRLDCSKPIGTAKPRDPDLEFRSLVDRKFQELLCVTETKRITTLTASPLDRQSIINGILIAIKQLTAVR